MRTSYICNIRESNYKIFIIKQLNDKKFLPDVIDLIIRKILFHETPSVIEVKFIHK